MKVRVKQELLHKPMDEQKQSMLALINESHVIQEQTMSLVKNYLS